MSFGTKSDVTPGGYPPEKCVIEQPQAPAPQPEPVAQPVAVQAEPQPEPATPEVHE